MTMPDPPYLPTTPVPTEPATPHRRKRWPFVAGGVALLVLLAAFAWSLAGGRSFDVAGMLVLQEPCYRAGSGGYSDIQQGAQVVITDASGATIATGTLGAPEGGANRCGFDFTVEGVPAGEKFYGLEVSHRGVIQYPEDKLREQDIIVSLG